MSTFSERSALVPDPVSDAAAARRARGEQILDLTRWRPSIPREEWLAAPPAEVSVCEAIAQDLANDGLEIEPVRIVPTCGAGAAIDALLTLLCDPGDELLVPEPSATPLERLASSSGVALAPYAVRFEGAVDPAALWEAIGDRTRAIVVAHPAIPTGTYLSRDTIEALDAIELPYVIDETAYGQRLEGAEPRRVSTDALGFSLGEVEGLAWIAVHGAARASEAVERLRGITSEHRAPPAPIASIAPALLASARRQREPVRRHASAALAMVRQLTQGSALEVPALHAGFVAPVRMSPGRSGEGWALALLEHGVEVLGGATFGLPEDEPWIALGLLTPLDALRAGVAALRRAGDA